MKLTPTAVEALVNKGVPFIEATYISGDYDVIKAGQKGTTEKKDMPVLKHLLHRGANAFVLTDFLPPGTTKEQAKTSFQTGDTIAIELTGYERDGAGFNVRGTMTKIADAAKQK